MNNEWTNNDILLHIDYWDQGLTINNGKAKDLFGKNISGNVKLGSQDHKSTAASIGEWPLGREKPGWYLHLRSHNNFKSYFTARILFSKTLSLNFGFKEKVFPQPFVFHLPCML